MLKEYSNLGEHIVIKRSKRARRVALRLDNKARVFNLIVPERMSLRRAEAFAHKHQDWINEQLSALPDIIPFENNQTLSIFGEDYRLVIDFDDELKRTKIELIEDHNLLLVQTNLDEPAPRITRFLKTHAKKVMSKIADEKAVQINKTINAISIRDTKSRWGSCSSDGKISLSWRLIFAPPAAFDYVIAHEVAHLKYMDHSKNFWTVCEQLSNEYVAGKKWMRNHGKSLMRFGG